MRSTQVRADLTDIDFERVAAELLRALRGQRSQVALARRLGYRSNVVYTWEAGRGFPTASRALVIARKVGVEPKRALARFVPGATWLAARDPATRRGIADLLAELRGRMSVQALAERVGRDRFAVSRWLRGAAEPRLPDFLRLVEACTLRLLDFLAAFVSPLELPSVAETWKALEATRSAAFEAPWSQAVLRALELSEYRALPKHREGWIAARLGISREDEAACIDLLSRSGQISMVSGRYQLHRVLTVDARRDPASTRALREWWTSVGLERLRAGVEGTFSYNLCGVSEADLQRLRALYRAFFSEVQAIVAASQPVERVVLMNMQILALDGSA